MNRASVMALPNISCRLERELFRYTGTFSPQLHAFGYEGRAGMHEPLYLSFGKWNHIMLHHVAHQVDIRVASWWILCMHSLLDRNLSWVSLRPTIFDSSYCYVWPACLARSCAVILPFSAATSPLLHVLSWFLNMTGIGIHRILTAGACLTFQCLQWLDDSAQRRRMLFFHSLL